MELSICAALLWLRNLSSPNRWTRLHCGQMCPVGFACGQKCSDAKVSKVRHPSPNALDKAVHRFSQSVSQSVSPFIACALTSPPGPPPIEHPNIRRTQCYKALLAGGQESVTCSNNQTMSAPSQLGLKGMADAFREQLESGVPPCARKERSDLSLVVAVVPSRRHTHILSGWTGGHVKKLLAVVDREKPGGKRDYGMIPLVVRLGLRSMDFKHLQLSYLHWDTNRIEFVSSKTGQPLSLPPLPDLHIRRIPSHQTPCW